MPPRGRRSEVGGGGGALGALVGWGAVLGRVLDTEAAQARVAQAGNRDEPPATRARVSYRGTPNFLTLGPPPEARLS
eukprot:scaffold71985_cov54-Phaeocystis_antarctica.AAC.1